MKYTPEIVARLALEKSLRDECQKRCDEVLKDHGLAARIVFYPQWVKDAKE